MVPSHAFRCFLSLIPLPLAVIIFILSFVLVCCVCCCLFFVVQLTIVELGVTEGALARKGELRFPAAGDFPISLHFDEKHDMLLCFTKAGFCYGMMLCISVLFLFAVMFRIFALRDLLKNEVVA